jgi:hypothetical protein
MREQPFPTGRSVTGSNEREVRGFVLGSCYLDNRWDHIPSPNEIIHPAPLRQTVSSGCAGRVRIYEEALRMRRNNWHVRPGGIDTRADSRCSSLANDGLTRHIVLQIRNLRTSLDDRWLDSAVIDMYARVLVSQLPNRERIYLFSAQFDPKMVSVQLTRTCRYDYALGALFENSHWTFIFVDHLTKTIIHLNSDVVDDEMVRQAKPFANLFPDYTVLRESCARQDDQSSCGVYTCWWLYALLYDPARLLQPEPRDIVEFRRIIPRQLFLSYYLLHNLFF